MATVTATTLAAGATTASAATHCNGGSNIYKYGDWDCGTPHGYSPWAGIEEHDQDSFRRIMFEVRQGTHAGRFEVEPGDVPSGTAERAEVYGLGDGSGWTEGDAAYYAFSILYGNNWDTTGATISAQWRANNWSTGTPPLALITPSSGADRVRLQQRAGACPPPAPSTACAHDVGHTVMTGDEFRATRGMWHDFILYVDWSTTDGRLHLSHRLEGETGFTKVVEKDNIPTLPYVGSEVGVVYPKYGIYRLGGPQPTTHVLYNDSYCIARLYAAARSCLPQ